MFKQLQLVFDETMQLMD